MEREIFSKYDYRKYKRANVHTTIREELYERWLILSIKTKQPATKMFDVLISMVLEDEELMEDFKKRLKKYR